MSIQTFQIDVDPATDSVYISGSCYVDTDTSVDGDGDGDPANDQDDAEVGYWKDGTWTTIGSAEGVVGLDFHGGSLYVSADGSFWKDGTQTVLGGTGPTSNLLTALEASPGTVYAYTAGGDIGVAACRQNGTKTPLPGGYEAYSVYPTASTVYATGLCWVSDPFGGTMDAACYWTGTTKHDVSLSGAAGAGGAVRWSQALAATEHSGALVIFGAYGVDMDTSFDSDGDGEPAYDEDAVKLCWWEADGTRHDLDGYGAGSGYGYTDPKRPMLRSF